MPLTLLTRGLAVLGGVALGLVATYGLLFVLIAAALSAQPPDYPDTWNDVAGEVGFTLAALVVDMLLVSLAVALLSWGATGRWPRLRGLALIPSVSLAVALVLFAIDLVPELDEGWARPDCASFAVSPAAWRSTDINDRLTVSSGVQECRVLAGKTRSQVRALLGEPDTSKNSYWTYPTLGIWFVHGRVTETHVQPPMDLD